MDGTVHVPLQLQCLRAEFDHIHVSVRAGTATKFVVGSLHADCDVFVLAKHLKDLIDNEVLGFYGVPRFDRNKHHWSKPHVTLSKS